MGGRRPCVETEPHLAVGAALEGGPAAKQRRGVGGRRRLRGRRDGEAKGIWMKRNRQVMQAIRHVMTQAKPRAPPRDATMGCTQSTSPPPIHSSTTPEKSMSEAPSPSSSSGVREEPPPTSPPPSRGDSLPLPWSATAHKAPPSSHHSSTVISTLAWQGTGWSWGRC